MRATAVGVALALSVAACSGSDGEAAGTSAVSTSVASTIVSDEPLSGGLTGERPYDVFVPSGYDPDVAMPLVLLLHGYTSSGEGQESYFEFEPLAESRGFLYVHPDGTVDPFGERFWNATDACCAFGGSPPDDAAYLMAIIEEVSAEYSVDPKAVFIAGHSNGGFMSYRMACDHADVIAGVASLAGATFADAADCQPSEPVSVVQIHGTNDETIAYDGGAIIGNSYPSALETVQTWADHNGCASTSTIAADALDLEARIDGAESDVETFIDCAQGARVELWTINTGSHVPDLTAEFSSEVIDFLLANAKT